MSNSTDIFFPEGKEIEIMGKKVKILPFVLKTRMQFLAIIIKVFKDAMMKKEEVDEITNKLTTAIKFITAAGERIRDIYILVLGIDGEVLDKSMTMKDEVKVVKAIFEVNDLSFLVAEIQGMISLHNPKTE